MDGFLSSKYDEGASAVDLQFLSELAASSAGLQIHKTALES
jgi:hypothetical protein